MKILFKIIFFVSLIINVLNQCSGKAKTACNSDEDCTWSETTAATCTAIANIMSTNCSAAITDEGTCKAVVAGTVELCTFQAGVSPDPNTCTVKTETIAQLCTAAVADQATCEGVKSDTTKLCQFTDAIGDCNDIPRASFTGDITIKLKSVKGKAVVITLEPAEADKNKEVTAETEIENLQLTSGSSFTKDLTCKIASGSKLGDVDCTIDTPATKDTKYKLIKKSNASSVNYNGRDTFGAITVDPTEVTVTEDSINNPESGSSSSFLKISSFFTFLFLLF